MRLLPMNLRPHHHGHGVFVAKHSKTFEEFKAFSQNMGHTTTEVTDRFYSKFAWNDVKEIVMRVGNQDTPSLDVDKRLLKELREFQEFKRWQEFNSQKIDRD